MQPGTDVTSGTPPLASFGGESGAMNGNGSDIGPISLHANITNAESGAKPSQGLTKAETPAPLASHDVPDAPSNPDDQSEAHLTKKKKENAPTRKNPRRQTNPPMKLLDGISPHSPTAPQPTSLPATLPAPRVGTFLKPRPSLSDIPVLPPPAVLSPQAAAIPAIPMPFMPAVSAFQTSTPQVLPGFPQLPLPVLGNAAGIAPPLVPLPPLPMPESPERRNRGGRPPRFVSRGRGRARGLRPGRFGYVAPYAPGKEAGEEEDAEGPAAGGSAGGEEGTLTRLGRRVGKQRRPDEIVGLPPAKERSEAIHSRGRSSEIPEEEIMKVSRH